MAADDYEHDWDVTEAMIHGGGSFVQMLGRLHRLADADNASKLKMAFPEYWKRYSEIARQLKLREGKK
jgi:hypothetical protein